MYGAELAEVYEVIYHSRGKDWAQEAKEVAGLIRARNPAANSLLDVACGTGAHLEVFSQVFDTTAGLEIAEPMLERARRRLPDVPIHVGDMRSFDLGRTFDAVVCLFSSIGYLTSVSELEDAIACLSSHVVPNGVVVVEPWWFPENFIDGYVAGDMAREEGRVISRVSHATLQARTSRMEVRFAVGTASGIREFTEIDCLMLFTKDEYMTALEKAGCSAEFLPGDPAGRGRLVAVREWNR